MTGIDTALYPLGNILNAHTMPDRRAAFPREARSMYGTHLLHHLTADGAGLTASQIAVIALLEVYADLPWCVFTTKTRLFLKSIHITVLDVF